MEINMFKIWFERAMPEKFAPLLKNTAIPLGPASATPANPLSALPEADAIIASSIMIYDAAVLDQAPNLKIISRTGIGTDNIAIAAATERGIAVCNAPDGPTISAAEHAITLMMSVAKNIKKAERELRDGGKRDFFGNHVGLELYQTQLGLVGLGRIGGHVARIALALGMTVIAYDPFISQVKAASLGVTLTQSLPDLLVASDVVSLHLPLNDQTRHLINAERIAQMKEGAILINTSRGGLVDEIALLNALENGHLFGAGLDVTDPEPAPPDNPLLHRDDVIVTPHIASATQAGKDRLFEIAITQVLQVLRGERPANLVNPEVWKV
jgi:D-3-phosphoglycerate dehydrogenase